MASCRFGTKEDVNEATKLLVEFYKASESIGETTVSWIKDAYLNLVKSDDVCVILKDGGILIAYLSPSLIGPFKQSNEIVWWVSPDKRGNSLKMIKMYEDWALSKGAKIIGLTSLEKFKDVGKIYSRLGYKPLETIWAKKGV